MALSYFSFLFFLSNVPVTKHTYTGYVPDEKKLRRKKTYTPQR
jgi:hypothetical protein